MRQLRKKKAECELDMAPMIDMVFLLLIFFMCSATMQNLNTPEELELVTLIVYEKVPQKEAAERLGIVQGTVSKNFEKVKKFLRNFRKME